VSNRFGALLAAEARTEWRYQIPLPLGGLAAAWSVLAAVVPAAAPFLLFVEIATVGTFLVGALAVTERSAGILAALAVSPVRPGEYVAARIVPLAAMTVLAAVPVLVAGDARRFALVITAVALMAVLLLATGLAVAVLRRTLIGFLTWLPWPMIPLFAVPLAVSVGLLPQPIWYAVPTTGALAVIRSGFGESVPNPALALGYLALWTALAIALAVRVAASANSDAGPRAVAPPRRSRDWRGPAWLSFIHADLRNVSRDSVLVPIAASPLLLGLLLRFGYPPLAGWAQRVHGLDLDPYLPVLALLAVVLHIPVIAGMIGAIVVLDDLDDGVLRVIRVSPIGVRRYLAYRLGTVTGFAALGLAVAAPLSNAVPPTAWGAVALAVPVAPLFTLAVLAVARNRVQGLTTVKLIGLPVYAPIATWWLSGPATWAFAVLPPFWVVQAWAGPDPVSLAAGALCTALWLAALSRLVLHRL
jgi:hypothetical protein